MRISSFIWLRFPNKQQSIIAAIPRIRAPYFTFFPTRLRHNRFDPLGDQFGSFHMMLTGKNISTVEQAGFDGDHDAFDATTDLGTATLQTPLDFFPLSF